MWSLLFPAFCVLCIGSFAAALGMAIFFELKIKKEKKLFSEFLAETRGISQPIRASAEYDGETFIGGTVFCSDGRAFTFRQEPAFVWTCKNFGLKYACV